MADQPPPFKQVYSSDVAGISYAEKKLMLFVKWQSTGKISAYTGVPAPIAREVMNAWSVGSAVARQIKGVYPHHYVPTGE